MGTTRTAYVAAALLFGAGVVAQVFLIGMALVAGRWSTAPHATLGHALALPVLVMVVLMFPARLAPAAKALTWALLATYVLQADVLIELRAQVPVLGALHPVLALADIVLAFELVHRVRSSPRPAPGPRAAATVAAARSAARR